MTRTLPSSSLEVIPERVLERVLSRTVQGVTGCLLSTYSTGSHGYAQVGWHESGRRRMTVCHRVVWIAANGPIPEGMTVDHTCKQRTCVRLDHLRLLNNFENARRTFGRDWPLGECVNGHSNELLRRLPSGKWECAPCTANHQRAYRAKKRKDVA